MKIITKNTEIEVTDECITAIYLNNDDRNIIIEFSWLSMDFELSIDVVTGEKVLYCLTEKKQYEIEEIE